MITAIEIENFKGIGKRQRIEFAPITLLFGANSAGKTTIAHAMHYATEVLVNQNIDVHTVESTKEAIDLGGFESLLHKADQAELREFSIRIEVDCKRDSHQRSFFSNDGQRLAELSEIGHEPLLGTPSTVGVELTAGQRDRWGEVVLTSLRVFVDGRELARLKSTDRSDPYGQYERYLAGFDVEHPILKRDHGDSPLVSLFEQTGFGWGEPDETTGEYPCRLEDGVNIVPTGEMFIPNPAYAISDDCPKELRISRIGHELSTLIYQMTRDVTDEVATVLRGTCHIGPLRDTPARGTRHAAFKRASWYRGMAAYNKLLNESEVAFGKSEHGFEFSYVLDIEDQLGAPYRVERKGIWVSDELSWRDGKVKRAEQSHLELQLVDLRNGTPVDLNAVGSGVSQVIPILVAACDQTLPVVFVEQPELHLHPRHQGNLADTIRHGFAGSFSSYVPANNHESPDEFDHRRCILETHSEHMILRLQRRIRESAAGALGKFDQLKGKDVVVIYVGVKDGETYYRTIELDKHGEFIQPWPDDFFDLDFNERFA